MVFVADDRREHRGPFRQGFIAQMRQALANIAAVLRRPRIAAAHRPAHLYVLDMDEYLADLPALGAAYREVMGRHFPAMAWSRSRLVERLARLEIEATAVLP